MKKILLVAFAVLFFASFASGEDIAYIVTNEAEQAFINSVNDLNFTYEIIFHSEINDDYNFSKYKIMLINNDYFVNWHRLPVNEKPTLIASGQDNIVNWGWSRRSTLISDSEGVYTDIDTDHEIGKGLPENFKVYNKNRPDIYIMDKMDIYDGWEIIASNPGDSKDAVVALAKEDAVLTKSGEEDTHVNANSIFFGITESEFWTNETKQLFKNSLTWLMEEEKTNFDIELKKGENLVSVPLILSSKDVDDILVNNPEIALVKEYNPDTGNLVETNTIENNRGYFLKTNYDTTLTVKGWAPDSEQNVLLEEGMNLVGTTSLRNINLSELPPEVIEVGKRVEGEYEIATNYGFGWFNEFELEPGKGYWFKLNNNVSWEYEP